MTFRGGGLTRIRKLIFLYLIDLVVAFLMCLLLFWYVSLTRFFAVSKIQAAGRFDGGGLSPSLARL